MGVFDFLSGLGGGGAADGAEQSGDSTSAGEGTDDDGRPADPTPGDFQNVAESLAGRSDVPTLDFTVESLERLDGLAAGPPSAVDDELTYGSYLGETIRREFGGEWVADDGWQVAVDLPDDRTTIAVFDAAAMSIDGDPVFSKLTDRLEAVGAERTPAGVESGTDDLETGRDDGPGSGERADSGESSGSGEAATADDSASGSTDDGTSTEDGASTVAEEPDAGAAESVSSIDENGRDAAEPDALAADDDAVETGVADPETRTSIQDRAAATLAEDATRDGDATDGDAADDDAADDDAADDGGTTATDEGADAASGTTGETSGSDGAEPGSTDPAEVPSADAQASAVDDGDDAVEDEHTGEVGDDGGDDSNGTGAAFDAEVDRDEDDTGEDGGADEAERGTGADAAIDRRLLRSAADALVDDWPERDLDFTPGSLPRLDAFVHGQWDGRFRASALAERTVDHGASGDPLAQLGAYYGEVLVRWLDGEWVGTADGEGAVAVPDFGEKTESVPVFTVARECLTAPSTFAHHFDALVNRLHVDAPAVSNGRAAVFDADADAITSGDVITQFAGEAESFAEEWPDYGLDYSPRSLRYLEELVEFHLVEEQFSTVPVGDETDPASLRLTARATATGAYLAAVLLRHCDAQWRIDDGVELVIDGAGEERTVDPVAAAVACLRGDESFTETYLSVSD